MKKQDIISVVEALLEPIAAEKQYEIVDVEYEKEGSDWYLRVYADKEGGFSINDCVDLSRALDKKLDEADPIKDPYHLEVSSPGLDRPLKKDKDFVRNMGKPVEGKLYKAMPELGLDKEWTAELIGYDAESKLVSLRLEDGSVIEISRKDLASIRLAVIF